MSVSICNFKICIINDSFDLAATLKSSLTLAFNEFVVFKPFSIEVLFRTFLGLGVKIYLYLKSLQKTKTILRIRNLHEKIFTREKIVIASVWEMEHLFR